jgi:adenosine deaminase
MVYLRQVLYLCITLSFSRGLCEESGRKIQTKDQERFSHFQFNQCSEQMKNMQKSELHLHLGGAWPLEYLKEISQPQEFADLSLMLNQIQAGSVDYHTAFRVFSLISKIMHSDERVEDGVAALCKDLLRDNVVYAEFRTGLKDLGSGLEGYLAAVLRGIQRGTYETPLRVGVILSVRRDTHHFTAEETIDLALKYRNKGVVGIDVSGDSTQGDGKQIFSALIRAKENNLPITLHIGESKEETAAQQMMELFTIQPERIGHGVHLCEEGNRWIKEKKILVELCLTSAFKAGMISNESEHPALKLLLQGHPVAICTDDPLVFNTTLSEEYTRVAQLTGLSPEEIEELQKHIHIYNFFH